MWLLKQGHKHKRQGVNHLGMFFKFGDREVRIGVVGYLKKMQKQLLSQLATEETGLTPDMQAQSCFYDALCAAELSHPDATARITEFLHEYILNRKKDE